VIGVEAEVRRLLLEQLLEEMRILHKNAVALLEAILRGLEDLERTQYG
jgi:hypothetical protein